MVKLTDRAVSAWTEILAAGQIPAAWPRWRADWLPDRFPRPKRFQDRLLRRTGPLPQWTKEAKVIRGTIRVAGQGWLRTTVACQQSPTGAAVYGTASARPTYQSPWFGGVQVPTVSGLVGLLPRASYIMLPLPSGCPIDTERAG